MPRCLVAALFLALLAAAGCDGPQRRGAWTGDWSVKPELLVDPLEAVKAGYSTRWASGLPVQAGNRIREFRLLDGLLLTIETPSNLVSAYSARDGALRWRAIYGSAGERLVGCALAQVRDAAMGTERARLLINSETQLYVVSPEDGTRLEQADLRSSVSAGPVVTGELAIFGGVSGLVFAHNVATGYSRWAYQLASAVRTVPLLVPRAGGDDVLVADDAGSVVFLDAATGKLHWRTRTFKGVLAQPALGPGSVLVASTDHALYCLDRSTGRVRWRHVTDEPLTRDLVASGELLVLPLPSGRMLAMQAADKTPLWESTTLPLGIHPVGTRLLLHTPEGLHIVQGATGKDLGRLPFRGQVQEIQTGADGALYLLARNGQIERLDPAR